MMKNRSANIFLVFAILSLAIFFDAGAADSAGGRAPHFAIENLLGGEKIDLADHEGKVVYVDFWASWCGPCLRSFPFMQELHERHSEQGLVIIAINMDRNRRDALDFLDEHPITFLIGEDAAGDVATEYGVIAMPSSFVVGRDGVIKEAHYGFRSKDKEEIAAAIGRLMLERS